MNITHTHTRTRGTRAYPPVQVIALMFMNMLISIIMGHYGYLRALPKNKDLVNSRDVEKAREAYEIAKCHATRAHHLVRDYACP